MKTIACTVATVVGLALLCSCGRQYAKQDFVLQDLGPPSYVLTSIWTASWQDPKRNTSEAFTMDLVQKETNVTGTAVFMDANGTRAEVTGQATGSKIRLLMSPHPTAPYQRQRGLGLSQTGPSLAPGIFTEKPIVAMPPQGPGRQPLRNDRMAYQCVATAASRSCSNRHASWPPSLRWVVRPLTHTV